VTKTTMFRVFIPEREIASLLDMLRYDAAVVLTWDRAKDPRDRDGWEIVLRSDHYTPDRWKSFGLYPEALQS